MTLELGDVIAQIGGASVVREHTPLNVPSTPEGVLVWSGTIPVGHVLAVEITTNASTRGVIVVVAADQSWEDAQVLEAGGLPRMTFVTPPGREGPVTVLVFVNPDPFTVTGITTTLIPT
ncbi:hypothetical protein FOB82_02920 [Corynebacterium xerosis]|uniref:Uncharacterized protein n=1 Tax=Corynebacterium xerosis TaxID=1725 RepID=A0A6B8TML7_9CORY|nr:hypothetical protein [Corynebacterium xerosis]QGS34051.1 hypothetical protein FOB82_02920 [Corynebacterium xerosis]